MYNREPRLSKVFSVMSGRHSTPPRPKPESPAKQRSPIVTTDEQRFQYMMARQTMTYVKEREAAANQRHQVEIRRIHFFWLAIVVIILSFSYDNGYVAFQPQVLTHFQTLG